MTLFYYKFSIISYHRLLSHFLPLLVLSQIAIPAPTALVNMNIIVNPFIIFYKFLIHFFPDGVSV